MCKLSTLLNSTIFLVLLFSCYINNISSSLFAASDSDQVKDEEVLSSNLFSRNIPGAQSLPRICRKFYDVVPLNIVTYTVRNDSSSLLLSCASEYPVLWTTRISKAGAKPSLRISFLTTRIPDESDNITDTEKDCFRGSEAKVIYETNLHINRSEDITGLYSCDIFEPNKGRLEGNSIYLYGGTRARPTFLNAGKTFHEKTESLDRFLKEDEAYPIQCSTSYPSDDVVLELRTANRTIYDVIPTYKTWWDIGIDLTQNIESIRKGFNLTCKFRNLINQTKDDQVHIIISPSPDIVLDPTEESLSIYLNRYQAFSFNCKSIFPAEITVLTQNTSIDVLSYKYTLEDKSYFYYRYHYVLQLRMPENNLEEAENLTIRCGKINSTDVFRDWSYSFFQSTGELALSTDLISESYTIFRCNSRSPETTRVFAVPCSTFTECQALSSMVYEDNNTEISIRERSVDQRYAKFHLRDDNNGYFVRCSDVEYDSTSIVYYDYKIGNELFFGSNVQELRLVLNSMGDLDTPYLEMGENNASYFFVNDSVNLNCISSQMITISQAIWSFVYRNNFAETVVPTESAALKHSSVHSDGRFITSSVTLVVPNEDLIGVKCTVTQIKRVSPIKWKTGQPYTNAREIEVVTKERYLPLDIKRIEKVYPPVIEPKTNSLPLILSGLAGLGIAIGVAIGSIIYYKRKIRITIQLTKEEIESFLKGSDPNDPEANKYSQGIQLGEYDKKYEVPRKNFFINFSVKLGHGEFGNVYKGFVNSEQVAVKTLKPTGTKEYLLALLSELKVMIYANGHANIVTLIGAYTDEIKIGKLFLFVEYCEFKSLDKYLKANEKYFINPNSTNMNPKEEIQCPNSHRDSEDMDIDKRRYVTVDFIQSIQPKLNINHLITWSYQIASAMDYLSDKRIIHRDLSTRNVLVKDVNTVKVTDFGLAKKLIKYNFYNDEKRKIAWQWQPPEALLKRNFSMKSDVWSFGITMWEIFTFGKEPWDSYIWNLEFMEVVLTGERLAKPEYASIPIYELMLRTWKELPEDRPDFKEIVEVLSCISD